jgi:hypothetical protein
MINERTKKPNQKKGEYEGREVTLYDPFRIDDDEKKFAVYVENPDSGEVNKVKFGSDSMEIKRDDPDRRKSFRARMRCDSEPPEPHTARFWSCYFWRDDLSVSDILDENTWTLKQEIKSIVREKASKEYCKNTPVDDMGFTQRASCKAQGYIERSDGEKRKSDKYKSEEVIREVIRRMILDEIQS